MNATPDSTPDAPPGVTERTAAAGGADGAPDTAADAAPDVIGTDHEPSRWELLLRRLGPRRSVLLAAAAAGVVAAGGLAALWSPDVPRAERAAPSQAGPPQLDGGVVQVCDGRVSAFVAAHRLPRVRTQVLLPLRGDDILLPVLTEGTEVLSGVASGTQEFVPADDGTLAVVVPLSTVRGPDIVAVVGGRRLWLEVQTCGGAPTWGSGPTT